MTNEGILSIFTYQMMERSDSIIIHYSLFIIHSYYSITLNSMGAFKAG
jgi:hypothetical protein